MKWNAVQIRGQGAEPDLSCETLQRKWSALDWWVSGGPIQCTACGQRCQILEGAGRLLVVVEEEVLSSSSRSGSELDV